MRLQLREELSTGNIHEKAGVTGVAFATDERAFGWVARVSK